MNVTYVGNVIPIPSLKLGDKFYLIKDGAVYDGWMGDVYKVVRVEDNCISVMGNKSQADSNIMHDIDYFDGVELI